MDWQGGWRERLSCRRKRKRGIERQKEIGLVGLRHKFVPSPSAESSALCAAAQPELKHNTTPIYLET